MWLAAAAMDNRSMQQFLMSRSPRAEGAKGQWQCCVGQTPLVCLTDVQADRKRFMSPIGHLPPDDA